MFFLNSGHDYNEVKASPKMIIYSSKWPLSLSVDTFFAWCVFLTSYGTVNSKNCGHGLSKILEILKFQ